MPGLIFSAPPDGYPIQGNVLGLDKVLIFQGSIQGTIVIRVEIDGYPAPQAGVTFYAQYQIQGTFSGYLLTVYQGSLILNPSLESNYLYFLWNNLFQATIVIRICAQWSLPNSSIQSTRGDTTTITVTANPSGPNVSAPGAPTASFGGVLYVWGNTDITVANQLLDNQTFGNYPLYGNSLAVAGAGGAGGQAQPGFAQVLTAAGQLAMVKLTLTGTIPPLQGNLQEFALYTISGNFAPAQQNAVAYQGRLAISPNQTNTLSFLWPNNVQASVQIQYVGRYVINTGAVQIVKSNPATLTYTPGLTSLSVSQPGQPFGTFEGNLNPSPMGIANQPQNLFGQYPVQGIAPALEQGFVQGYLMPDNPVTTWGGTWVTLTLGSLPAPQAGVSYYAQYSIYATIGAITWTVYKGSLLLSQGLTQIATQLQFSWPNNFLATVNVAYLAVWNNIQGQSQSSQGSFAELTYTPSVADITTPVINAPTLTGLTSLPGLVWGFGNDTTS